MPNYCTTISLCSFFIGVVSFNSKPHFNYFHLNILMEALAMHLIKCVTKLKRVAGLFA